jgi:WD40 repeat protein
LKTAYTIGWPTLYFSIRSLSGNIEDIEVPLGPPIHTQKNMPVSPDGRMIAVTGMLDHRSPCIWLLDAVTGRKLHEYWCDDGWPGLLKFSSDGRKLACGTWLGTILIYDIPEQVLHRAK